MEKEFNGSNLGTANDVIVDNFNEGVDHALFKKLRQRQQAKRSAKKAAKKSGLSNKAARAAGKQAKLYVKSIQKSKAIPKSEKSKAIKSVQKLSKGTANPEEQRIASLAIQKSKTGIKPGLERRISKAAAKRVATAQGLKGKELRQTVREAKQITKAEQLKEKGKDKKAKRVLARKGKTAIAVGAKKASKVVKDVAKNAILLPLVPLVPVMNKALKNKGFRPPKELSAKANLFYNEIVQKNKNSWEFYPDINLDNYDEDHIAPVIPAIVAGIVEFIKNAKNKKERGEKTTKTEEIVATGAEEAEQKIMEQAEQEAASEVGSKILFDTKTQIIIGVVLLIVVVIAFKLGKK